MTQLHDTQTTTQKPYKFSWRPSVSEENLWDFRPVGNMAEIFNNEPSTFTTALHNCVYVEALLGEDTMREMQRLAPGVYNKCKPAGAYKWVMDSCRDLGRDRTPFLALLYESTFLQLMFPEIERHAVQSGDSRAFWLRHITSLGNMPASVVDLGLLHIITPSDMEKVVFRCAIQGASKAILTQMARTSELFREMAKGRKLPTSEAKALREQVGSEWFMTFRDVYGHSILKSGQYDERKLFKYAMIKMGGPIITGRDLKKLSLPPGPAYTYILDQCYRYQTQYNLTKTKKNKKLLLAIAMEAIEDYLYDTYTKKP